MTITIREADPGQDYERAAEIISCYEPELITAERIRGWDKSIFDGLIRRRTVAVDQQGQTVGYASVNHFPWMKSERFIVQQMVDPAYCHQGIGALIYDDSVAFACEHGATLLETWVFENQAAGVRFAEKRGFTVEAHLFESTIDLHTFDESQFVGLIDSLEADGFRLFSLADAGNTRESHYKLWEVNYATTMDDPASTGTFPDFDEFERMWETSAWFRPDGQIVAAEGDKYVGLSAVGYFKDSNSAYNMMTGVMPEYRGRKLAQALKLMSIRAAKKWGVDHIRTNNDSHNAPMLAINRKLGYIPQPGGYRMTKALNCQDAEDAR
jgi:GNAT superfamily N-acetyltransferase